MFYSHGLDQIQHHFIKYYDPEPFFYVDKRGRCIYQNLIEECYQTENMKLGKIFKYMDDDTTLIVLSDHGVEPNPIPFSKECGIHDYAPPGIIVIHGKGVRNGIIKTPVSVFDIAPTILCLFGLPIGLDMDGKPLSNVLDKEYTKLISYIPTYDKARKEKGKIISSAADAEIMKRLRDLGYL